MDGDLVAPAAEPGPSASHVARRGVTRRVLALVLVLALAGGLVGAGVAAGRAGVFRTFAAHLPWASAPTACPSTEVDVVVAPEISDVVQSALKPLAGHRLPDDSCLDVEVQPQEPDETVASASVTALSSLPQIWIPDASLWLGQAPAWPLQPVGSLATSPVVLAATSATLDKLGWTRHEVSWPQALTPDRRLVAPAITEDAPALLGLLALARTLGPGQRTEQAVAAVVLAASRVNVADQPSAITFTRDDKESPVFLTSQHTVATANQDGERLLSVHPTGTSATLDYPIVRVGRPDDDLVVAAGTDLVVRTLQAPSTRSALAAAGFGPPAPWPSGPGAQSQAAAQIAQAAAFVQRVRTRATPSRLLALVDVSLSMQTPVRPGYSRAQLAVEAAAGAGQFLPNASSVGLWSFAGRQPGGAPYSPIAALEPLGTPEAGRTHRDVVNAALANLPQHLAPGGTALYDATLAAIRAVRESYDQNANNAVVVFTDGGNDFAGGITLQQFVAAAHADAAAHRTRPINLVTIGIGPDADMTALRTMAAAVGGLAYQADDPKALQTVLFDAIARRPVPSTEPPAVPPPG